MNRGAPIPGWNRALARFPLPIRPDLDALRRQGGVLRPAQVRRVTAELGGDVELAMPRLLPLAACFAVAPISRFLVGAIAAGPGRHPSFYFGANLEIAGGALGFSVHAEQAAINSAWIHGEGLVARLAVTAAPCGHCRQFMTELHAADSLRILLPGARPAWSLRELLPDAFGPADLKVTDRLLLPAKSRRLRLASKDALVQLAREAATRSHVPYSRVPAGCALELADGTCVAGSTAENAAYNPTLPAIASALSTAVLQGGPGALAGIRRAVLVEVAAGASQSALTEAIVSTCAPGATIEYLVAAAR